MANGADQISETQVREWRLKLTSAIDKTAQRLIGAFGPRAQEVASNLATVFAMQSDAADERIWREIAAAVRIRQELRHIVGSNWGNGPGSGKH